MRYALLLLAAFSLSFAETDCGLNVYSWITGLTHNAEPATQSANDMCPIYNGGSSCCASASDRDAIENYMKSVHSQAVMSMDYIKFSITYYKEIDKALAFFSTATSVMYDCRPNMEDFITKNSTILAFAEDHSRLTSFLNTNGAKLRSFAVDLLKDFEASALGAACLSCAPSMEYYFSNQPEGDAIYDYTNATNVTIARQFLDTMTNTIKNHSTVYQSGYNMLRQVITDRRLDVIVSRCSLLSSEREQMHKRVEEEADKYFPDLEAEERAEYMFTHLPELLIYLFAQLPHAMNEVGYNHTDYFWRLKDFMDTKAGSVACGDKLGEFLVTAIMNTVGDDPVKVLTNFTRPPDACFRNNDLLNKTEAMFKQAKTYSEKEERAFYTQQRYQEYIEKRTTSAELEDYTDGTTPVDFYKLTGVMNQTSPAPVVTYSANGTDIEGSRKDSAWKIETAGSIGHSLFIGLLLLFVAFFV